MAKDNLDGFELFYQEIPTAHDYLEEVEITDMVEDDKNEPKQGLSADQVSMLAQDTLSREGDQSQKRLKSDVQTSSDADQKLF